MTWKPSRLTREQMEERRLIGGRLLQAGQLSQAEIARRLGVSRATVSDWVKQLEKGGLSQLRSRPSTGRPSKLTQVQERDLMRCLKRGALVAEFPTARWTLRRISVLIKRKFGVTYHPNHLSRLLARLGWSPQVPLPQAGERDADLVAAWLKKDWPRIKKARRIGAEIVFFDEFGFSFQEPVDRTWAPKGQRPVLRRVTSERRGVSTAVGLTLSGKIYKRYFKGGMKSAQVIQALPHLQRHLSGPFVLIWDGAPIHKSHETKAYLTQHSEIMIEPLPPYAPDLNPEEYCHGNVKQNSKNATPALIAEARAMLDRGFARLRRRPDMLLNFIHHAGLSVRQLW